MMNRLLMMLALALAAGTASAGLGPGDYVQDGLVALYDGVYNSRDAQGSPVRDSKATTWANLAGVGTDDFVLPQGAFSFAENSITLSGAQASAPNCAVARVTGKITLETCVKSETSSTSGNEKFFLEIVNRAAVGYDGRSAKHFTVYVLNSSDYGAAKKKYSSCAGASFADYAPQVHSVSWVSANNVYGTVLGDGENAGTLTHFYTTSGVVDAPDGNLKIGNTSVDYTYFCIRVYDRELTDAERKLNAAVDAVRFQGKKASEVTLPEGYSFDAEGNLKVPNSEGEHRINLGGTVSFAAPHSENAKLVNVSVLGPVMFDETQHEAREDKALSFTGFDSISRAITIFKGGFWDFGAAGSVTNFWQAADSVSSRRTVFSDGAVVTNVGVAIVAGVGGADNQLTVSGGASLYAQSLILGCSTDGGQRSVVTVDDGALLSVAGDVSLSEGEKWRGGTQFTGNELTVLGEGTRLFVGGETSLSRKSEASQTMRPGGSTFTVADGAAATLGALHISTCTSYNSESNTVVFARDANVSLTSLLFATGGSNSGRGGNRIEILDGAVVENSGTMTFGSVGVVRTIPDVLLVSNATFKTGLANVASKGVHLIWSIGSRLILSGAESSLTLRDTVHGLFYGTDSKLTIENGAQFTLPIGNYNYTQELCSRCSVEIRSGAAVSGTDLGTGNSEDCGGASNRLVVASGASLTLTGALKLVGNGSRLDVDDAILSVGSKLLLGANDNSQWPREFPDQELRISGKSPSVRVDRALICEGKYGVTVSFALPEGGYAADVATAENPLVQCGGAFDLGDVSSLRFENAEAFAESHARRRNYVLVGANAVNITPAILSGAAATLPKTMSLENNGNELVLKVRPKLTGGLLIMVK